MIIQQLNQGPYLEVPRVMPLYKNRLHQNPAVDEIATR